MISLAQAVTNLIPAPRPILFLPDIVPDAAAAGLRYAISLEAAIADLRAAGEIP
jgi:hypothetical protein